MNPTGLPESFDLDQEEIIVSPILGEIILKPNERIRYCPRQGWRTFRRPFRHGPKLMIIDEPEQVRHRKDCYFFYHQGVRNGVEKFWKIYRFDPEWIDRYGRWKNSEFEYLARETMLALGGK